MENEISNAPLPSNGTPAKHTQKSILFLAPVILLTVAASVAVGYYFIKPQHSSAPPSDQNSIADIQAQLPLENTTTERKDKTSSTQNESGVISGQEYIITSKVEPSPNIVSFSIFKKDGTLVKILPVPPDVLQAVAGNVRVMGGHIYYLSGSSETTLIGFLDIRSGQSKILPFTRTHKIYHPHGGNAPSAIQAFAVSADNSKIAWMDNAGKIMVARTDGSLLQMYESGVSEPTRNYIALIGGSLYFDTFGLVQNGASVNSLRKINLTDGSLTSVVDDWQANYAISGSGKYVAYISKAGESFDLLIKNTQTDSLYRVPNIWDFSTIAFSSDETKMIFLQFDGPAMPAPLISVDLTNGKFSKGADDMQILDFVSNSQVLISQESGIYITDLDGKNPVKISNDPFRGILTVNEGKK